MIGQKPDGMIRIKISSLESRDGPTTSSFGRIKHYPEPKTQSIKTRIKSVKNSEISKIKKETQNLR